MPLNGPSPYFQGEGLCRIYFGMPIGGGVFLEARLVSFSSGLPNFKSLVNLLFKSPKAPSTLFLYPVQVMPTAGKPGGQVSRIFTNPLLRELEFGAWDLGF